MLKLGRVIDAKDPLMAGILNIQPLDGEKNVDPIVAIPCTPNLGGGGGFFSPPTKGTIVLYADLGTGIEGRSELSKNGTLYKHVWIGGVGQMLPQEKGRNPLTNDKNTAEDYDTQGRDYLARSPGEGDNIVDFGLPEPFTIYADNLLPQADVWKQKNGHKIIMVHKITEEGRYNSGIFVQAKSGKRLHIDDQPKTANGGGDRITLIDEKSGNTLKANRFELISSDDEAQLVTDKNQLFTTNIGSQHHTIVTGSGDQRRDNQGKGNIVDVAFNGDHKITAESNITRQANQGDISETAMMGDITYKATTGEVTIDSPMNITLKCGESTIVLGPASITLTSPVITLNGANMALNGITTLTGVTGTLNTHQHVGNLGAPTPII